MLFGQAHDANLFRVDFDSLGECASAAAGFGPHAASTAGGGHDASTPNPLTRGPEMRRNKNPLSGLQRHLANKKPGINLFFLLSLDSIHSSIPYIYSLYYQYYLAGWGSQTFLGARLSRRAHNPQSGFCAFKASRKFKSTPRYFLSTLYFLAAALFPYY